MAASGLAAPTQEENEQLARTFERSCGPDGFVDAAEAQRLLRRTGLQEHQLSAIWDLSDLDRDRRLSLREFACAMTLAEQARHGRVLPVEVRPEQQAAMAAGLERLVAPKAKPREDFSTVDTSASFRPKGVFESESFANPLRGRDPLPRSEAIPGEGRGDAMVTGRLAQVLKLVARLDPGGELQKLSGEVLAERRDLEQQLQRRRTLEEQLREARGRLDEAREQQRAAEVEAAASRRRCAQMQDELVFVTREVKGVEEDLEALRSAVGEEAKKVPLPYTDPEEERRDVLTKVRAERELVMKDQKAIEELRTRLDEVFKQKLEAQSQQQALLERQRQCEQDRSLMLTAMEAERAKFMTMRADRLRVWQERADLEKQLQDLDQELLVSRQVPGRSVPAAKAREEQPNRRKGVPHEAAPPVVYGGASARSGVPRHWRVTPDPVLRPEAQPEPFGSSEGRAAPRRDNRGVRADA